MRALLFLDAGLNISQGVALHIFALSLLAIWLCDAISSFSHSYLGPIIMIIIGTRILPNV